MDHFYFVRHGETVWNVENKICGATDIELTQKGHDQAEMRCLTVRLLCASICDKHELIVNKTI